MKSEYTTVSLGTSQFIREVSIPVAKTIEKALAGTAFQQAGRSREVDDVLYLDTGPKADANIVAGVVGVLCFLGTWAVSKFLDEIYAWKIQPAIQKCLKSLDANSLGSTKPSTKTFLFGVWLSSSRVLVLARVQGQNYAEVAALTERIQTTLRDGAIAAIESETSGVVHVYNISRDSISTSPKIYSNLNDALHRRATHDLG